jgi:regulator of protease activity HflC (stomatin/prohibitin superfamily)
VEVFSSTIIYKGAFDLNNNVIQLGPLTLVTVDEGHAAVMEDNGKQKILDGGETYLLNHRNWKFRNFVSCKIQSNVMQQIRATSADNVLMSVNATVIWRITDVYVAAKNAANTIESSGSERNHAYNHTQTRARAHTLMGHDDNVLCTLIMCKRVCVVCDSLHIVFS